MARLISTLAITVFDAAVFVALVVLAWGALDSFDWPLWTYGILVALAFAYIPWRRNGAAWKYQATIVVLFCVALSIYDYFRSKVGVPPGQPMNGQDETIFFGAALLLGTIGAAIQWKRRTDYHR
jgi:hypothetical protein